MKSTWRSRLTNEAEELSIKIAAIELFIYHDPMFATLSPKQRKLLQLQHTVMSQYLEILHKRLINE